MLQRSTHPGPVDVPDIPATVEPGQVVDWPHPLAGFEPEPEAPPVDAPVPSKKRAAAPATTEEE